MRLKAMEKLQEKGWQIGLRFDPLMCIENFKQEYALLFKKILSIIKKPHSITLALFAFLFQYLKKCNE